MNKEFTCRLWVLLCGCLLSVQCSIAQNASLNNTGALPDASAMLDISSNSKGLLIPRMLQNERNAIASPATGLMVYQTDGTAGFYYYNGSSWTSLTPALGGSGTINFLPKFTAANTLGNSLVFDNGSTVGINNSSPSSMAKLHVSGAGNYGSLPYYQAGIVADGASGSANVTGVYGEGGWRGVFGRNPGTASGTEAIGVGGRLEGSAYTSTGYGVKGESVGTGPTSYGVYGIASGTGHGIAGVVSGTGDAGRFDGGANGYGVIVVNGISGFGTTTPTSMSKVQVSGLGTYGSQPYYQAGIVADGSATSANGNGVYGESGWRGVYGRNPGTASGVDAIGVAGRTEGSAYTSRAYGVKGEAVGSGPSNYGVYGFANSAVNSNYGVYGTSPAPGYAGYFSGNVNITGSISKGSGTFMIDHPLDPENKYLFHSFVESPDMMNIYNGNIITDGNGNASVTLPDYFEALNKDFRYQLTVIGDFAQVMISEKVHGNRFSIKTNKPGIEVSWQVTGVRHDKYAEKHRVVPVVEKEPMFRGYYIHASEWGMPAAKSFDSITTPKDTGGDNQTKH